MLDLVQKVEELSWFLLLMIYLLQPILDGGMDSINNVIKLSENIS